ncbi:MAG: hypothetical protein HYW89_04920 [Candidatus Sungiibacteriota bacterium]|uniref:Uncharacterized protein n=1 Tax=Candidatus Sungiibacteriota bacterium TaxID=2750080 RepID=A0A7T5RJH8_9BACT|nr:MAG: hypothetical protein HYW89_04920 [Candidatus Sungbacteria bacterium]
MPPQIDSIKNTAAQILSHPTWDLVTLFALLAIGFFYGISTGKGRMAATIIYTYVALAITSALPLERIKEASGLQQEFFFKAGVFILLFLILAFSLGSRRGRGMAPASSWWQIFLLSFLQVGFLIHLTFQFLPPEKIKLLAPLTKNVFANPDLHIWWLVAPIAVLILLRRLERKE